MSNFEAGLLIDAYNEDYKAIWERERWKSYVTAASNGAKIKNPNELINFSWEQETVETTEELKSVQELELIKSQLAEKFGLN